MTEEGAVFRAPFSFPVREKKETILEKKRSYPFLVLLAAALLLAADQVLKVLVLRQLKPLGSPVTAIPGLLEFTYVENRGVAFGLLQNQIWFVGPITLALVVVISVLLFRYQGHSFFSYAA